MVRCYNTEDCPILVEQSKCKFKFRAIYEVRKACFNLAIIIKYCPYFIIANLACILKSANELLQEWRTSKTPKQNWLQRTAKLNENWVSARASLMNVMVSGHAVDETRCMKCLEHVAVIRCHDCHLHTRLCGHCDQLIHEIHPFHDRGGATGGFFKPIPPTVSLDCESKWVSVGMYSLR